VRPWYTGTEEDLVGVWALEEVPGSALEELLLLGLTLAEVEVDSPDASILV